MSNSFLNFLDILKQLCWLNTACCTTRDRRFCDIYVNLCCVFWPDFGCWAHPKAWLNPMNKKILRILTKFSEFWKFLQISKMCSYQNILSKIFRNLSSQLHQNILSEISQIFWKNWWVQNFQIFFRKFIRTCIFVDRTKAWLRYFLWLWLRLKSNWKVTISYLGFGTRSCRICMCSWFKR